MSKTRVITLQISRWPVPVIAIEHVVGARYDSRHEAGKVANILWACLPGGSCDTFAEILAAKLGIDEADVNRAIGEMSDEYEAELDRDLNQTEEE